MSAMFFQVSRCFRVSDQLSKYIYLEKVFQGGVCVCKADGLLCVREHNTTKSSRKLGKWRVNTREMKELKKERVSLWKNTQVKGQQP